MTDRIPLDDMTDDQLDALYERLEKLAATIHAFPDANDAANIAHARCQRDAATAAIARVRALHQPMGRGPFTVCTHCSGWNGARCLGVVTPHPCDTLTALDAPAQRPEAATGSGAAAADSSTAAGP